MESGSWYIKAAAVILSIVGVVLILYYGSPFLQPLAFGAIFAMLVNPVNQKLQDWGAPKIVSIGASVLLIIAFFVGVTLLVSWQVSQLSNDWPQIKERIDKSESQAKTYISNQFNVPRDSIKTLIQPSSSSIQKRVMRISQQTAGVLTDLFLIIIFTIVFLASQERFEAFIHGLDKSRDEEKTQHMIEKTSLVANQYLVGKLVVMLILGGMYAGGFLLAGIKYAVLLALIGALLSIIPYVGNVIAGGIAILLSLVSGGGFTSVLLIVGVMTLAQILESYVLTPIIVGDKVNLSVFGAIVSVFAFSMVWGISGAIIAIPLTAMIKIILQYTGHLRPVANLLGVENPNQ